MRTLIYSKFFFAVFLFLLNQPQLFAKGNPVRAKNGMVVSACPIASEVGVNVLKKGGNAIDAAVAVGFALAVTYPNAGNLGGGGFMVIHRANGENITLDFREAAPLKAYEKMFLDESGKYNPEISQKGWKSSGVPGTVDGLITALNKYGTKDLKEIIQPAIELAANGFILPYNMVRSINSKNAEFSKYESSKKIFTIGGEKLPEGYLLIQKDLASTLSRIHDYGKEDFYNGEIARKLVDESEKNGGIFSLEDLKQYRTIERESIIGSYRGYKIISMGPPSSGGVAIVQALNTLENFHFDKNEWGSSRYLHLIVETLKHVYADRAQHLGDSDFYPVPVEFLTSKKYGKEIANSITENALPSEAISASNLKYKESEETTHYSVADKFGNCVSVTYTLNSGFGNKIVVDGLGFLLNNEMDDFSSSPGVPNQYGLIGSEANSIQPKKRMLSSMTPTIILKDEKPFMVIGTPGGSTIITQVLQVIMNVIDFGMNIYDAINSPRIHHQWLPDEIDYEEHGITEDVKQNLLKRGHKFGAMEPLGLMEGIIINQNEKVFYGTSDTRAYGKAMGY